VAKQRRGEHQLLGEEGGIRNFSDSCSLRKGREGGGKEEGGRGIEFLSTFLLVSMGLSRKAERGGLDKRPLGENEERAGFRLRRLAGTDFAQLAGKRNKA